MEDAEQYAQWMNDIDVTINLLAVPNIYSLEKEREALIKLSKEGYNFAIVTLNNNEVIGNCSLGGVNPIHRTAEAGIFIRNKNYWNKGYGTEAMKLLLDYDFNVLNLNNIMLRGYSFNKRVIKSYKKCGLKEIGRRREAVIIGSKKYDHIYGQIGK